MFASAQKLIFSNEEIASPRFTYITNHRIITTIKRRKCARKLATLSRRLHLTRNIFQFMPFKAKKISALLADYANISNVKSAIKRNVEYCCDIVTQLEAILQLNTHIHVSRHTSGIRREASTDTFKAAVASTIHTCVNRPQDQRASSVYTSAE